MTIFDCFMFRDELDMLGFRLDELAGHDVTHVICEAPVTHRSIPKPLVLAENRDRLGVHASRVQHVVVNGLDQPMAPWAREHAQRNAAWPVVNQMAADDDLILIADVDEFPSAQALAWRGPGGAVSLFMRTALFAVDWLVPDDRLPPTAVMCTAGWLRQVWAGNLAWARDNRGAYPVIPGGGWHFSWTGGPEAQRRKLEQSTCHTELLGSEEGSLIADGTRWRTGRGGEGHLPVYPAEVDESWPAFIRERRCPENWFRPRLEASLRAAPAEA